MDDKKLKKMKMEYEAIEIPEELRQRVEAGICKAKEEEKRMKEKSKVIVFCKRAAAGVAAALLAITVMANSGASIAHAMEKIPVIGAIAEVVTFREYESSTNDMEANVKIPEVSVENQDGTVNQESTEQINKSIQDYTDEIIAQYEADVEAVDGEGKMDLQVDYTVMSDNERLFSIRFDESVVMAGSNHTVMIYHIDKQTGEMMKLPGLFRENVNYIDPISENIKEQMREQMEADEMVTYWLEDEIDEWNFKSITEDTNFYINKDGKLVIVFDKYEVAPGYMGSVEFVIPTEVIQDLVQDGFVK